MMNLQICNHLMHIDLPFVPSELIQRFGRINRSGSNHEMITEVYLIMADSYEEQLLELLQKKENISSEILTGIKVSKSKENVAEKALKALNKKRKK